MSRLIRSTLILALLFPAFLSADAGKEGLVVERPELPVVGSSFDQEVVPNVLEASSSLVDGRRVQVWRQTLRHEGAAFVKAHFTRFNLRKGDVLILRSASGKVVEELTLRGPKNAGSFWGLSAFGDTLDLELHMRDASHYRSENPFRIDRLMLGDPAMLEAVTGTPMQAAAPEAPWTKDMINFETKSICTPADFEDVICYDDDAGKWANVLASVGVMNVGGNPASGALWCSGSNVSPQNYVLTNAHCVPDTPCASAEFVFKYYRTGCNNGSSTNVDWQSFRCDETVAQSPFVTCEATPTTLDFSLNSVVGDPASTFGFATPDPIPITDGEGIYIVQHPAGRPHEIAHGSGADVDADGNNLRYYNTLDTEGGSSGSPIFRDSDDKLIGLHHCGGCSTPGTGNRGMLMSDIYPQIEEFLCTPEVSLGFSGVSGLEQVEGNDDGVIDPGETWEFFPNVRNTSCATDASNVTAEIAVGASSGGDVVLLNNFASFGPIDAGTSAPSTAPIQFQLGSTAECAGDVVLDLVNLTAASGPFPDVPSIMTAEIGEVPTSTLLFEDFAAGIPGTWTIVDGGTGSGAASTWTTDNPGSRTLLDAPFAICDSDALGTGQTMDEEMITPEFAVGAGSTATLQFNHDFRHFTGGLDEQADVDIRSTATGGAWVNIANYSGGGASGMVTLDITAQAAGQNDVQVRFRFHTAEYEWWWAIDDVYILEGSARTCSPFNAPFFSDGFESGDLSAWSTSSP